jgi:outer membrane cobalamin receptor
MRCLPVCCLAAIAFASTAWAEPPDSPTRLDEVTVTGLREEQPKSETPVTVHSVNGATVRDTKPTHPADVMNTLPGVWVNTTGGEGHMTAIRQPLTTNPVYLYLEDGVPTRSTGFFNHNALYEINVPQSNGIEVSKGPGTVLYGSDAIGGVVNVLTRPAPDGSEAEAAVTLGAFGFRRLLASGGHGRSGDGLRRPPPPRPTAGATPPVTTATAPRCGSTTRSAATPCSRRYWPIRTSTSRPPAPRRCHVMTTRPTRRATPRRSRSAR